MEALALIGLTAFVASIVAGLLVAQRRLGRQVAARLRAIDEGALCPVCNGMELFVEGDVAHCRTCGRTTNLAAQRAMAFDPETIANIRELPRGGRDGPR
jgi:hypothetical protein